MLLSLGDGNWKMGEGARIAKGSRQDVDEKTILEHFTCACPRFFYFLLRRELTRNPSRSRQYDTQHLADARGFKPASSIWVHLPAE